LGGPLACPGWPGSAWKTWPEQATGPASRCNGKAIAADGALFAPLDAGLMLTPAGDHITVLALTGIYWRRTGRAGAGPDRTTADRCAAATIRSFMAQLACALAPPGGRSRVPGL